jgi:hypothetical protein
MPQADACWALGGLLDQRASRFTIAGGFSASHSSSAGFLNPDIKDGAPIRA